MKRYQKAAVNLNLFGTDKLVLHIFGALVEFEHNLIRERTRAGLTAARARGRLGGRPKSLDADKRALAVKLYEEREHTVAHICQMMGISKPTIYKYAEAHRIQLEFEKAAATS